MRAHGNVILEECLVRDAVCETPNVAGDNKDTMCQSFVPFFVAQEGTSGIVSHLLLRAWPGVEAHTCHRLHPPTPSTRA